MRLKCVALTCWTLGTGVFAQTTTLGSLNGTVYPLPRLAITSAYKKLFVGQPIVLDATISYVPPSANPYHYLFSFGDTDAQGLPQRQVLSSTRPMSTSHVYSKPGTYHVNLTISDTPFIIGTSISGAVTYGITSGGYPAPVFGLVITVLDTQECYDYSVAIDWNQYTSSTPKPYSGKSVKLSVTVKDPQDSASMSTLTQSFASLGDHPTLQLKNGTNVFTFGPSSFEFVNSTWVISLSDVYFQSAWPVKARFISEGMTIMSCSIRSLDVDLTVPWSQSSAFGYDMSSSGASLISASYKPSYFRVYHDHCTRNEAVAIYGVGAGSGQTAGLGALATFTSTGFDTMGLRDLGRSGSSGSLCSSLSASACSSLQIVDATFQNGWLFVLTSAGLFKTTESFKTVRNVSVTASFTRLMTGLSLLDSGEANTKLHGNVQGKTDCMRIGQDYLYVSYLSNVVYASASNAVLGIWSPLLNLESIPGLGASYTFISSERDVVNSAHVFLVGVPLVSQAGCPSSRLCQFDKVKVLSVTDTSSSITYSFPESFITSGLHFHGSNNDLFAFGSEIWLSNDGGLNWIKQIGQLSSSEFFVAMQSSLTDGSYALQTSLNRTFFGKSPTTELSLLPSAQSGPLDLLNIMFDLNGDLFTLSVDGSPSYTATSYPSGFIMDASGTLRSEHISKRRVITESDLRQSDASFGSSLVPIFVGQHTMQFYVMDSTPGTIFKDEHLGYQIAQKSGGSAYIKKISSNGKLVEAISQVRFNPESVSQSPAVSATLSVDTLSAADLGDVTAPLVTIPVLTSVILRLTNIVTNGWLLSDVGKTVIFNYGSIYVASVTSSTTATGLIVSKPLASTSMLPGFWSIFDFRAFNSYALTVDQSLTVNAAVGGLVSCTLSTGPFALSYAHIGMYLLTNSGWGVIQTVASPTVMTVTTFSPINPSIYAAGVWQIVSTAPGSISGAYPVVSGLTRPWELSPIDCLWISFSSPDSDRYIRYLAYYQNVSLSASMRGNSHREISYWAMPKLTMDLRNPSLYSYVVQEFTDPYNLELKLNVQLFDQGVSGSSVLTFKPSSMSLKCEQGPVAIRVLDLCPPTRALFFKVDFTRDQFLYGDYETLGNAFSHIEALPYNYRPPSALGRAIPVTDNIYNAAPDMGRYIDKFDISKKTGSYKQCAGKSSRSNCGCTDSQKFSGLSSYSDCIDRAIRVSYLNHFAPNLQISEAGNVNTPLKSRYILTEINGRTDYCLSTQRDCFNSDMLKNATMDPVSGTSIKWMGAELYHFRVQVIEKEYCSLSTEFTVFVYNSPPTYGVSWISTSIAGIGFGTFLFIFYLHNNYKDSSGW